LSVVRSDAIAPLHAAVDRLPARPRDRQGCCAHSRDLPLDRRAPDGDHHGPNGHGQELLRLRTRAPGLSQVLPRDVPARPAPLRRAAPRACRCLVSAFARAHREGANPLRDRRAAPYTIVGRSELGRIGRSRAPAEEACRSDTTPQPDAPTGSDDTLRTSQRAHGHAPRLNEDVRDGRSRWRRRSGGLVAPAPHENRRRRACRE
jgi:hypothetical protein